MALVVIAGPIYRQLDIGKTANFPIYKSPLAEQRLSLKLRPSSSDSCTDVTAVTSVSISEPTNALVC